MLYATFSIFSDQEAYSLSGPLRFKLECYSLDILVALYENEHVIDCTKGENKGRVLTNDFVVRCLEKAHTVKDVSARKTVTGKVTFNLWEGYSRSKCRLVSCTSPGVYICRAAC